MFLKLISDALPGCATRVVRKLLLGDDSITAMTGSAVDVWIDVELDEGH